MGQLGKGTGYGYLFQPVIIPMPEMIMDWEGPEIISLVFQQVLHLMLPEIYLF